MVDLGMNNPVEASLTSMNFQTQLRRRLPTSSPMISVTQLNIPRSGQRNIKFDGLKYELHTVDWCLVRPLPCQHTACAKVCNMSPLPTIATRWLSKGTIISRPEMYPRRAWNILHLYGHCHISQTIVHLHSYTGTPFNKSARL
jgi:hypothetical protein